MKIKICKRNTNAYDYYLLHWNNDGTSQRTNGNQKAVSTSKDLCSYHSVWSHSGLIFKNLLRLNLKNLSQNIKICTMNEESVTTIPLFGWHQDSGNSEMSMPYYFISWATQ